MSHSSPKGAFLPDGSFLLVGHDAHDLHDAVELVEEGIIWMLAIAVPLSLLTAIVSSALIFRRLEAINRLSLEIRRGHLDRRLPVGTRNDEFDRLAAHLNGMLDGIQDLTDSLRQVTNNIAHELRTPLTRIHNKVEAARRQPLSVDDAKQILDATVLELDGLLSAFGALLRIAYIDAGTLRSSFKEFELSETLAALAEDFEPIARDGGKRLTAQIAPGLRFFGDKRLVVQMIVNLLENAIAHSGGDRDRAVRRDIQRRHRGARVRQRRRHPRGRAEKGLPALLPAEKGRHGPPDTALASAWWPRSPSFTASALP